MAFTDFADKTITQAWGLAKLTVAAATAKGDMLDKFGNLSDADSAPGRAFDFVAMEPGAAADTINVCKMALLQKDDTIAVGGKATAGSHSGAADEVLWLSATAGRPGSAPVAGLSHIVGHCIDTKQFVLDSTLQRWSNTELMAANKTVDEQDCGKVMIATADAVVVTLPSVATGLNFVFVNGGDAAAQLLSISPAAADLITGPDYAGTDDKDWENTKATAQPGDAIAIHYKAATGWIVTDLVGTWAQEA